jgi:phosphatidylglycerophosphate synthase
VNVEQNNQFVVDLLTTLRTEKFRLAAWWHFFKRSWDMSCVTARDNPGLYRSWKRTTIGMAALICCLFCVTIVGEGFSTALRLLPGLALCVGWQQCDLFWHLGLNRITYERWRASQGDHMQGDHKGPPLHWHGAALKARSSIVGAGPYDRPGLLQCIGLANTITLLRGLCSAYLLARILTGLFTPDNIVLVVFLSGCMTDLLDGMIARSTGTCSKLGQILDSEIDFTFYLLVSIVLLQNGLLPLWLCVVLWLRFCLPLCAALGSYFVLARPLHISSTIWGKCAGLCQALYILALLTPPGFFFVTPPLRMPLLVALIALFAAALLAQVFKAWKCFCI